VDFSAVPSPAVEPGGPCRGERDGGEPVWILPVAHTFGQNPK
jgi:hypothetical protein